MDNSFCNTINREKLSRILQSFEICIVYENDSYGFNWKLKTHDGQSICLQTNNETSWFTSGWKSISELAQDICKYSTTAFVRFNSNSFKIFMHNVFRGAKSLEEMEIKKDLA